MMNMPGGRSDTTDSKVILCVASLSAQIANSVNENHVSLHAFPVNEKLFKVWQIKLKIDKTVPKFAKVCSSHFIEDDFINPNSKKTRCLKKGAVPSSNIPITSTQKVLASPLKEQNRRRDERRCRRDCSYSHVTNYKNENEENFNPNVVTESSLHNEYKGFCVFCQLENDKNDIMNLHLH